MTRVLASLTAIAILLVVPLVASGQGDGRRAAAEIINAGGETVGVATFTETDEGVEISVEVTNLEPGRRGIHIHEHGVCEPPDFASAGAHFNPTGAQHGLDNPEGPHAGDLPNIEIGDDGTGALSYTNDLITLGEDEHSIVAGEGTAIVIHAGEDDQVTDPAGNSGARIACGVIALVAQSEATPATGVDQVPPATGGPGSGGQLGLVSGAVAALAVLALAGGLLLRRRGQAV